MKRRVVVTGMGILTTLGANLQEFYNNLIAGKSGIGRINSIDTEPIECKIGGDLGEYDYKTHLNELKTRLPVELFKRLRKIMKSAPLSTRLSLLTAVEAFQDAGLIEQEFDRWRTCGIFGGNNLHDNFAVTNILQFQDEPDYMHPLTGLLFFDTDTVASIAEVLQFYGPLNTVGGACAGAGIALRDSINQILLGDCDIAITGGCVMDYSNVGLHAMSVMGALGHSGYTERAAEASRPFDRDRQGFIFSHGSGMLVVEELEHALARGARIYCEILAVTANNDGNHLSNPSSAGQTKVMQTALAKAGVTVQEIDYINAHATSTPLGDSSEISSIKRVFGKRAYELKVNAPKSMLGHTGWAAHAIELIGAILQMQHSRLHPSINIDNLDPAIDLDVCAGESREMEVNCLLNNSFGIGGINCSTVVKKFKK